MGGIISGFLAGAGRGAGQAGQMLLADKLVTEREEANFLRESSLRHGLQAARIKSDDARTDKTIASADTRAANTITSSESEGELDRKNKLEIQKLKNTGGSNATNQMKNAAALRAKGYPAETADAIAHGALTEIKDEMTGEMVVFNPLANGGRGKQVGRLTSADGKPVYLAAGDQL